MSTPLPPSPTASPMASVSASPTATAKKSQPLPWTQEETVQLIRAYQEKWYALRRGQLKSSQWEEVAVTVAARCGYEYGEPSKSATQCRHKMEKLRQRHRAVKKRLGQRTKSGWPFFELMEQMERGPMPISVMPMAEMPHQQEEEERDYHDRNYHGGGNEDDDEENSNKVRSIDFILRRPTFVNRFSGKASFLQGPAAAAELKRGREAVGECDVAEPPQHRGREMVVELADEMRAFAQQLIGVENMRMKMMKETERYRVEMEKRRMSMILQSQQKIVHSINTAFGSSNKLSTS
ncbi:trihelix transcription factor ENAP1-like [Pyrus communis]|uniref:trihelix transcription factor ENAP1-like n=1 Tax=Pyrus communis TaxID=23211 RepID=UPI0035C21E63